MKGSEFEEVAFFRALGRSGVKALLIGRRALVLLGLPVLTADYDFWLATDDIERFNMLAAPFGLVPTRSPDEARAHGRYVLENDERVDVLVARSISTVEGEPVRFEDLWARRQAVPLADVVVHVPDIDDLIRTKRFAARPRDAEDIRLLEALKRGP